MNHILANGSCTELYICRYIVTQNDTFVTVTATYLMTAIRLYISDLELHQAGINLDLVDVLLSSPGGGVPEAIQGKQQHHHKNEPVVKSNVSNVDS